MMGSDIACEVPRAAASEKTRVLDPEPQPEGGRCAWGDSNVILAIAQSLHPFRASQVSLSHCQRGWPCLSVDQARWTRALQYLSWDTTSCEERRSARVSVNTVPENAITAKNTVLFNSVSIYIVLYILI